MCRMWVDASGRLVGWVFLAGDISRVDGAFSILKDGVNTPEDGVCLSVSAATFPPSFDHSFVVSVNLEVSAAAAG